jgi:integrase
MNASFVRNHRITEHHAISCKFTPLVGVCVGVQEMPKKAVELGPLAVSRLRETGLHSVGGAAGLQLQISASGARSWLLSISIGGKRREMGLGGYPGVPLADAREAARAARAKVAAGVDPILERKAARSALAAAAAKALTFDQCSARYIKAMSAKWTTAHELTWVTSLATYAGPIMGRLLVRDVDVTHVLAALEPIWSTKTETAARVRGRIESVLDWATTRGYREGLNPARWKGHLDTILPAASRVKRIKHQPALPASDVAAFMAALRLEAGIAARALEFAILTAARSGEVRGATWAEVDLEGAVWVIPAERMKAGREHRVPLSPAAVTLLKALPQGKPSAPLFLGVRGVGPLSTAGMTDVIERRMNAGTDGPRWVDPKDGREVVPHGFRSTFRDWCSECTNYPPAVVEMALAHTIDSAVEAAYRRGDLFEKRRKLMADWARFCARVERANVIAIRQ